MEKKTTRRIIGVLVIVALVLVLLPLMLNFNDPVTPSTPVQTARETTSVALPEPPVETTKTTLDTLAEEVKQPTPEPDNNGNVTLNSEAAKESTQILGENQLPAEPAKEDAISKIATTAPAAAAPIPVATPAAPPKKAVTAVKKDAWVVQMGSFKNKAYAERLLKKLIAKGYPAFTHQAQSIGQTRVYVGPEAKRITAKNIAKKIALEVKMKGVVVCYPATKA